MVILYILLILAMQAKNAQAGLEDDVLTSNSQDTPATQTKAIDLATPTTPGASEDGDKSLADLGRQTSFNAEDVAKEIKDDAHAFQILDSQGWTKELSEYFVEGNNQLNQGNLYTVDENGVIFHDGHVVAMYSQDFNHLDEAYARYCGAIFQANPEKYKFDINGLNANTVDYTTMLYEKLLSKEQIDMSHLKTRDAFQAGDKNIGLFNSDSVTSIKNAEDYEKLIEQLKKENETLAGDLRRAKVRAVLKDDVEGLKKLFEAPAKPENSTELSQEVQDIINKYKKSDEDFKALVLKQDKTLFDAQAEENRRRAEALQNAQDKLLAASDEKRKSDEQIAALTNSLTEEQKRRKALELDNAELVKLMDELIVAEKKINENPESGVSQVVKGALLEGPKEVSPFFAPEVTAKAPIAGLNANPAVVINVPDAINAMNAFVPETVVVQNPETGALEEKNLTNYDKFLDALADTNGFIQGDVSKLASPDTIANDPTNAKLNYKAYMDSMDIEDAFRVQELLKAKDTK